MKNITDLSETKEVKSLVSCIYSLDANGGAMFTDCLSDCETNEEIKDLCNGYLRAYLDPSNDALNGGLSEEETEERLASVDALDRASFYPNNIWLSQLQVTIRRAIYGLTE